MWRRHRTLPGLGRRLDGGGGERSDQGLYLLQPVDLGAETLELLVEPGDLAGALQLHQLPLVVVELPHGVAELGLGAGLELLPAYLAELPRLRQEDVERRGDRVGVGPELVDHE